jgi:hypothetical protein
MATARATADFQKVPKINCWNRQRPTRRECRCIVGNTRNAALAAITTLTSDGCLSSHASSSPPFLKFNSPLLMANILNV